MSPWFIWLSRWIPQQCWCIIHHELAISPVNPCLQVLSVQGNFDIKVFGIWNQYHLNSNPFFPHDGFYLCPQVPWKHLCCGLHPWAVMTVQLFLCKLAMLAALCCGMLMKDLKSHPSTMQVVLAALSAAWSCSISCSTLTRAVFLWKTGGTS